MGVREGEVDAMIATWAGAEIMVKAIYAEHQISLNLLLCRRFPI